MRFIYLLIGVAILTFSCKSSEPSTAQIHFLKATVDKQSFTIESTWAYPRTTNAIQQVFNSGLMPPGNTANAISLIGNSNFLTISGDSISSYLPYFGERQMQVGYGGNDSAIQFKGVLKAYRVVQNKDNSYTIKFQAKSNSENFQVSIKLYPNLKTTMTLQGNSRFSISYAGTLEPIIEANAQLGKH